MRNSGAVIIEEVPLGAPRQRYAHLTGVYRSSRGNRWFGQFRRRGRLFYVGSWRLSQPRQGCHSSTTTR